MKDLEKLEGGRKVVETSGGYAFRIVYRQESTGNHFIKHDKSLKRVVKKVKNNTELFLLPITF